jgi:ABC-type multidrug transport system ATPase subunit
VRPAIEVRAVGQRTRSGEVTLRDISLAVAQGELAAIIGGARSGKNALLNIMSGLQAPSSGTVIGSDAAIGYVPQGDTIHPALPLARALGYTARLRGVAQPDVAVSEVLRELDLAGQAASGIGQLSGGERKRAAIAAELLARPELFFLDEPTDGLDPARGRELMRALRGRCDSGATVVLTTQNPLDADRSDKVAVLAAGGHLAFFGTPDAARDYFGADGLDEIYDRLAGVGDPAKAWSRRFFQFSRTVGGVSAVPFIPLQPGPERVPDTTGPHSAGPIGPVTPAGPGTQDGRGAPTVPEPRPGDQPVSDEPAGDPPAGAEPAADEPPAPPPAEPAASAPAASAPAASAPAVSTLPGAARGGAAARVLRPVRQWTVLTVRNTDQLFHARRALAFLVGTPALVLVACLLLFPRGAFDRAHPNPVADVAILFWTVFGGFFIGLGYGLPQICTEQGVLRRERFAGLGAGTYILAKAAVLVPALAVADALVLAVFGVMGRLPEGRQFGAMFLTLLLSSVAAAALGLLVSAVVSQLSRAMIGGAAVCFPQVLFAGALLPLSAMVLVGRWLSYLMTDRWAFGAFGQSMGLRALWAGGHAPIGVPLAASYGTAFDLPVWNDWVILAGFTLVFFAAAIAAVASRTHVVMSPRRGGAR